MIDLQVYELIREAPLRNRSVESEAGQGTARGDYSAEETGAGRISAGEGNPGGEAEAGQAGAQEAGRPGLRLPLWSHFVVFGIPCAIVFGMLAFGVLVLMMFDEGRQFHRLASWLVDSSEAILSQVRDLEIPGWAVALLVLLCLTGLLMRQGARGMLFKMLLTLRGQREARSGPGAGVMDRARGVPAMLIDLRREAVAEALASREMEQPLIAVRRGTSVEAVSLPGLQAPDETRGTALEETFRTGLLPPSPLEDGGSRELDRAARRTEPSPGLGSVGLWGVALFGRATRWMESTRDAIRADLRFPRLSGKLFPTVLAVGVATVAFVGVPRAIFRGSWHGLLEGLPAGAPPGVRAEAIAPSALMPDQSELRRRIALEGAGGLESARHPAPGQVAPGKPGQVVPGQVAPDWLGTVFDRSGIPLATNDVMAVSAHRSDLEALNPRLDRTCPHPEQRCFPLGRPTYDLLAMAGQSRYDQTLTIDARLQLEVTRILDRRVRVSGLEEAAAIVLRPSTGEVLAMTSVPGSSGFERAVKGISGRASSSDNLAAFGLKPPGSTFKLVTAMAALRKFPGTIHSLYRCKALGDDRVGAFIPEVQRTVHDDELDRSPHGLVNLETALRVSCNAFFAQLAVDTVKPEALIETAGLFGIQPAHPNTVAELNKTIEQAAFGQGEVLATPLQMAMVAGTVANHGVLVRPTLNLEVARQKVLESRVPVVTPEQADLLARGMRGVVISGTAHEALNRSSLPPIAGKTGTAEVEDSPSHAWFIGYAPFLEPGVPSSVDPGQQIALAVLLPNAGYGGRYAAPVAGEIVRAAQNLGFIPASGSGARAISMASVAQSGGSRTARP